MNNLGLSQVYYPILGAAKLLGIIAILIPGYPNIKSGHMQVYFLI